MKELCQWLSGLHIAWGKTVADLHQYHQLLWNAAGLLVMVEHFCPHSTTVASPSGVDACLPSLSIGFSFRGKIRPWKPVVPQGFPIQYDGVMHRCKRYL